MKRKITFLLIIISGIIIHMSGQRTDKNILKDGNIQQIEEYLKTARSDDPKKNLLKQKLIKLKNEEWMKGGKDSKPMAARPLQQDKLSVINIGNNVYQNEKDEFNKLMIESSFEHKEKTVNLLNTMFNEDSSDNKAVLLIRNRSKCNIIIRVDGVMGKYDLPIPATGENFLILNKGDYMLKSNICNSRYSSHKNISNGLIVNLSPEQIVTPGKI